MKKIIILGKKGFIGRSLAEYLIRTGNYDITAVSHEELDLLQEDAVRRYIEQNAGCTVIHAAVWSKTRHGELGGASEYEQDVRMFLNVARCAKLCERIIYFGSGAEYGKQKPICRVAESDVGRSLPDTEYGLAKYTINQMIENSENIYNLRIFGLYGKYEDYRRKFVTGACAKAVFDLDITVRKNAYFDFLYIDDFCRMVEGFIQLKEPNHHTYNIVSGQPIDLLTLAHMVVEESGKPLKVILKEEGLANEYTANGDLLQYELNFHKFTGHRQAIRQLLDYFMLSKEELDFDGIKGNV